MRAIIALAAACLLGAGGCMTGNNAPDERRIVRTACDDQEGVFMPGERVPLEIYMR